MNPQRTANSGLTGCLSLGVHRKGFAIPEGLSPKKLMQQNATG